MAVHFRVADLLNKFKPKKSMTWLSGELGVDAQTVMYWNQGKSVPKLPTLIYICKVVGCRWVDLGDYITTRGVNARHVKESPNA